MYWTHLRHQTRATLTLWSCCYKLTVHKCAMYQIYTNLWSVFNPNYMTNDQCSYRSRADSQYYYSTLELELLSGWSSCAPTPSVCVDFLQLLWAPPTSQKHGCRCTGYFKLPPGANECVHGVLRWTDIPLRVYSSLIPSVPRIGYG